MKDVLPQPIAWNPRGVVFPLRERVLVMGILNVTPDSFSDGGRYTGIETALAHAEALEAEGADILDIGGESSRPGSRPITLDEELARLLPVVSRLAKRLTIPLSIDTTKAEVARRCLDLGAAIINDISALRHDAEMASVVAGTGAGVILMHMQGEPATMQEHPGYGLGPHRPAPGQEASLPAVLVEVRAFLQQRMKAAVAAGIALERIALDPGIGFGKRLEDNLALLGGLPILASLGRPLVIGPSRKSFLGSLLKRPVSAREWGTAAAVAAGVLRGAQVIRVHAVRAMKEVAEVSRAIREAGSGAGMSEVGKQP